MNKTLHKSQAMYNPSACPTGEMLLHFVTGSLSHPEDALVMQHIAQCSLCSDAAEGLQKWAQKAGMEGKVNDQQGVTAGNSTIYADTPLAATEAATKFNELTSRLNLRLRQRLHEPDPVKPQANIRTLYKPVWWMAAAASVALLVTAGFIVWFQNHPGSNQQAQLQFRKNAENLYNAYGEMPAPPDNPVTTMLTVQYSSNKGIHVPPVVTIEKQGNGMTAQNALIPGGKHLVKTVAEPEYAATRPGPDADLYREEYGTYKGYRANQGASVKNIGGAAPRTETTDNDNAVFINVQQMPSFPGGETAYKKFLGKNLRYPGQAAENGVQGTVYVSFVVKADGQLSDIKIIKGIGSGCDAEALRVVKKMPSWNPGYQNGRNVPVKYTLKVDFKIQ